MGKPLVMEISFNSDASRHGTLFMDGERVRSLTSFVPADISLIRSHQPERERVEKFIAASYTRYYGARITCHYPMLMSVSGHDGNIAAAVGVRMAARGALFLEQYLPNPVEAMLTNAFDKDVKRSEIVEIGNLASAGSGASVFLFVALAAYLQQHRLSYAVATATQGLRRSFALLEIDWIELGTATSDALPDKGAAWGSYYGRNPKIVAGRVPPAFANLDSFMPSSINKDLGKILSYHPREMTEIIQ